MEDLKSGLLNRPYSIPAKYFYDAKGSELFEKICSTNEYYPSRAEESLLKVKSSEIIKKIKPKEIFEFGSGTSRKGCKFSVAYPLPIVALLTLAIIKGALIAFPI